MGRAFLFRAFIGSAAFLVSAARAQWDEALFSPVWKSYSNPFRQGDLMTVWGNVRLSVGSRVGSKENTSARFRIERRELKSDAFASGRWDVKVALQKDAQGRLRKAPLVVYMPGIFSDLTSRRTENIITWFASRGFHVFFTANTFWSGVVDWKPKFLPGSFVPEAELVLRAVAELQQELRVASALESTQLIGESYGAFLSTVVLARDELRAEPLLDGPTTLLSPPLDLRWALKQLDTMMDRESERARKLPMHQMLAIALNYFFAQSIDDLWQSSKESANALIAYGAINRNLHDFLRSFEKMRSDSQLQEVSNGDLRFEHYLTTYGKPLVDQYEQRGRYLIDWIENATEASTAHGRAAKAVRILSADDDFLNEGREELWSALKPQSVFLPSAGHSGYLGSPWFTDFLDLAFRSEISNDSMR